MKIGKHFLLQQCKLGPNEGQYGIEVWTIPWLFYLPFLSHGAMKSSPSFSTCYIAVLPEIACSLSDEYRHWIGGQGRQLGQWILLEAFLALQFESNPLFWANIHSRLHDIASFFNLNIFLPPLDCELCQPNKLEKFELGSKRHNLIVKIRSDYGKASESMDKQKKNKPADPL